MFSHPLSQSNQNLEGDTINLHMAEKNSVALIEIEEDIHNGQNIQQYKTEAYIAGQWKTITSGLSIGRRRLEVIEPVETNQVRLIITKRSAEKKIRKFAVYAKR